MDRNALAILTNQLGGYDEVEKVLGVNADLIERAISGEQLTHIEQAEIETAYNQLYLDPVIAFENDIDTSELESQTEKLNDALHFTYDIHINNSLREAIAENKIDTGEDVEVLGYYLFANINDSRARVLVSELLERGDETEIREMVDALLEDYNESVNFWDIQDSAFWEWFRETFYGDE